MKKVPLDSLSKTMKNSSDEKEKQYRRVLDEWAEPIIRAVIKKFRWLHPSRFSEEELYNEAFVVYRKRQKKLEYMTEELLKKITKAAISTYIFVNDKALKIPGGQKGATEKLEEILAPLNEKELIYEESTMSKDLTIDYHTLLNTLDPIDKIVLQSMLFNHTSKLTESILKGLKVKNPKAVMKKAESRIVKMLTESGYP